jgi:hypothetical protein
VSQSELDSIRIALNLFDELYRDLYDVGQALRMHAVPCRKMGARQS